MFTLTMNFMQLDLMRLASPGFDYKLEVDEHSVLRTAVWMTASQRHRLNLFGDVLFLDAAFTHTHEKVIRISLFHFVFINFGTSAGPDFFANFG